ncbi:MAG TPA: zf-HC2 domain-containing protein [Longimicrobiales bacterium]|nr:zf-HC2 domain-containing protein [Longimicrobiales bacterium]
MMHVDDGVLMAYMDDELSPAAKAEAAEHVLACPDCRQRLDALRAADEALTGALALVSVPAPVARAHAEFHRTAGRRGGIGRSVLAGPFVRAAGLVLLLAAGASAAVPGSPVRNWIRTKLVSNEAAQPGTAMDRTSGVSILPSEGQVDISIDDAARGTRLRVRVVDAVRATVTVPEAKRSPVFHTSPGHIGVSGVSGRVLVDLPKAATVLHVSVNGEPYVAGGNGSLRSVVTAETRDGELMFTLH